MLAHELLWKRYENEVKLHEGYLNLVVKINIFYYAITGAIVSFYFLHKGSEDFVFLSLILPFLMSLFLMYFFLDSARASKITNSEIKLIADSLGFKTYSAIAQVLGKLLWLFSILLGVISLGLAVLFFLDESLRSI